MSDHDKPELDISQSFRFAWKAFLANVLLFITCEVLIVSLWVGLELFTIELDERNLGLGLKLATHLLYLFLNAGLWLGLIGIALTVVDGNRPSVSMLFSKLLYGPAFFAGQVIYLVVFLAGLALLVAPGFYWGGRLVFFGYAMAGEGVNLFTGLRTSVALTGGLEWKMARFLFLIFLFNIIGAVPMGLGLIVTIPMSVLAIAQVYRKLTALSSIKKLSS